MKYIIDFTDNSSENEITSYLTENNCEIIQVFNNFLKVYLVKSETVPPKTSIVEFITNDDEIVISPLGEIIPVNQYFLKNNPNYPSISISTTDEKDWWKNYVIVKPEFEKETYEISRKGNRVNVYIMDSGIEATHPEFSNSSIVNLFSITDEYADTNGHGTAIASVISGKTCGLTNATLKIVKIFDKNKTTRQSDILSALDAILGDFLVNSEQMAVLNCSWHIDKNEYIENKIRNLIMQGIAVVVAAGNSGVPIANVTPASMPEVLTIGSYGLDFNPSNFSNYSNPSIISNTANSVNSGQLDGWAPGEQIWVAALDGGYAYCSGTSISAAVNSCVLAYNISDMLLSENDSCKVIFPNLSILTMSIWTLSRENLLELSDSKYIDSKNRITTLLNNLNYGDNLLDYYELKIKVGERKTLKLFEPRDTKHIEIIGTLPDGFSIVSSGHIIANPISITENYQIFDFQLRVTDLNDSTKTVNVIFGIINSNFDESQLPLHNPILKMTLDYSCTSPDCIFCDYPLTCVLFSKFDCTCLTGFS